MNSLLQKTVKRKSLLKNAHRPVGILRFLGTHCDRDVGQAFKFMKKKVQYLWFKDQFDCRDFSAFILPGGFSYGDYLRSGALAARTPIMKSLKEAAKKGYPILGICNGFQILCEAHLLPGALIQNKNLRYIDQWIQIKLYSPSPFWAKDLSVKTLNLPMAHKEGCYYISQEGKKRLEDQEQIWWKYKKNPNGSFESIAGVMNKNKNVAGLMPHPERAIVSWMGGEDGRLFFQE